MEPATPAATAAASVGLAARLAGAFGQVAADVMMVLLAAIAGTVIALSGGKSTTARQAVGFFFGAVCTSLVLSWALASLAAGMHPALASAYTPTIVAFLIGTQSKRLGVIADKITGRFEKKIEG
jgi:hypothetical protein